jgi:SWI/SNF-related matrix-associated actin-dependent regulator 1 of chromatin subfamily A
MLELKAFDYQVVGYTRMVDDERGINGDPMGMGKTIQGILAAELAKRKEGNNSPTLVICPSSMKYKWAEEIEKWTKCKAFVLKSTDKHTHEIIVKSGMFQYFIINFESLKALFVKHLPSYQHDFTEIIYNPVKDLYKYCIIDEVHRCKNIDAQTTKIATGITNHIKYIFSLTGTPVMNSIADIASLLVLLRYLTLKQYPAFVKKYENASEEELRKFGKKFGEICYFRRSKDLLKLPPQHRNILRIELDPESRKEYDLAKTDLRSYLKEYREKTDKEVNRSMRAEIMVRIQQFRQIAAKGKLKAAYEFIDNVLSQDEKIVVFGVHREITGSLVEKYNALKVVGGMTDIERYNAVKSFQEDKDCKCLVGSIVAASVGITLTKAAFSLFVEYWFNFAINDQAEARTCRVGTTRETYATYLIAIDTFDEKQWLKCEKRRQLSNNITLVEEEAEWNVIDKVYSGGSLNDDEFDMYVDVVEDMV